MHTPRLLLTTLTLLPALASAATKTWDGQGAFERWDSGINWVGNNAPNSNDDLVWPANGVLGFETDNDFPAGKQFRTLSFTSVDQGAVNGWKHNGNLVGLTHGVNFNAGTTTLGLSVDIKANQTWGGPGHGILNGAAVLDVNDKALTILNTTLSLVEDAALDGWTIGTINVNGSGKLVLGEHTIHQFEGTINVNGAMEIEDGVDTTSGATRININPGAEVEIHTGVEPENVGISNSTYKGTLRMHSTGVLPADLRCTGNSNFIIARDMEINGPAVSLDLGTARLIVEQGLTGAGTFLATGTTVGPDTGKLSVTAGQNSFTGTANIHGAELVLTRQSGGSPPITGLVSVVDGTLFCGDDHLLGVNASESADVILARSAMRVEEDTVASLQMSGSSLRTEGQFSSELEGVLRIAGALTASMSSTAAGSASLIEGTVDFPGSGAHVLHVTEPVGALAPALTVDGRLEVALAPGVLQKNGGGTVVWNGTTGVTTLSVNEGRLRYDGPGGSMDISLNGGHFTGVLAVRDILATASGGTLSLADSGNLIARNVTLNGASTFAGVRPGIVNHPRIIVTDVLNLGGAVLAPSFPSGVTAQALQGVIGEETLLIQKNSAGSAGGSFTDSTGAPIAEGALISIPSRTWRLSYAGGDGNDVTLTLVSVAASGLTHGYAPPNAATNQWANNAVWNPAGPVFPGAALTFGSGAANVIPFNNFAAGTCMDSMKFTAAGYNVSGNPLALRADIETTYSTGTTIVRTPLLLTGAIQSFRARTNAVLQIGELTSGSVDLNGKMLAVYPEHPGAVVRVGDGGSATPMITGAGVVRKTGAGTAIFGRASTYTGLTTVESGKLRIEQQGAALGASGAGNDTEIYSGAVLELANLGGSPVTDKIKLTGGLRCDAGSGSASINGELLLNGAARSVEVAGGTLVLGGAVTGLSGGLAKSGPGTLYISGATHTFPGPFVSSAGSVRLLSNANRWPGAMQILGGSLSLEGNENLTGELLMGPGTSLDVTSGPQLLSALQLNNATVTTGASQISAPFMTAFGNGLTTWTGPLHVRNGSSLLRVNDTPAAAEDFLVNGALTGAAGAELRVEGTGTVKFTGNNTLPTIVLCEAVSVFTGSSPGMAVDLCGGNMAGAGTVGPITAFAGGGRIDPGLSPGILNSGSIAWNAETTFAAQLATGAPGTNYDQLNVTGTVHLGDAALLVIPSGTPSGTFTIINNDGTDAVTGTFAGLPESAIVSNLGKSFRISYAGGSGNDVTLTAIITGTGVTRTWDGGDVLNTNWNDPDNWLGDIAPVTGDDLVFPAAAADKTNTNNFAAGTTFNSIRIEGSGYTFNGNALSLNAGLTWDYATGLSTVNLPVTLVQPQTFSVLQGAQASITGLGAVNNGGLALTVDVAAAGQLTMLGISGAGGLTKNGAGRLTLGANSYSGATVLNAGLTSTGGVNGFGTAASAVAVNAQATLQFDAVTGTFTRPLTLNGKLAFLNTTMIASGGITLNGAARQIEVTGVTPAINGVISGSGGLQKTGSGTLTIGDGVANTFTGGATVTEGTLRLAKSINQVALPGPVTIGDGTGTDILLYATANQIANAATVNLLGSGAQMQCAAFSDTIGALRFTGGTVTGSGTLTVGERLESFAAATTATVDINFVPLVSPFSIAVEDGAAATDLAMASDWLGAATLEADRTGPGTFAFRSGTMRTLTLHEGTTLVRGLFTPADILLAGGTLGGDGITTAVSTESGKKGGISPGASPGQFTLSTWTGDESTELTMEIGGITPGTQHDQLIVGGVADPRNATLTLVPLAGYVPQPGQSITLIQNNGPDRMSSEFFSLPEGARFDFAGARAAITYNGGDGNDVAISIVSINSTGTTRIWDGEGGNLVWSNPLNWNDDIAPVAGDSLVFPVVTGPTQLITVNDLPTGTNFHRISLTGRNNVITGNAVLLNAGIQAASTGANFVALDITQTGPQTIEQSDDGTLTLMTAATINLGGHALTFSMPGNSKIIAEGFISGSGGVLITGASAAGTTLGSVFVSAANNYSGACTMISGVLRVNSPGSLGNSVSLSQDSRLILESASPATFTQPVTLRGEVISANAPKQWNGVVTLPAGTEGVLTSRPGADFTVAGRVQGAGGLAVLAEAPVKLAGTLANTFTGGVRVISGDLVLQKPAGVAALPGPVEIYGTVRLAAANQIADTAVITMNEDALLLLANFSDTIAHLYMTGATVTTGAGILTLTGGITTLASATPSSITGELLVTGAGLHDWNIADGPAAHDLSTNGIITAPAGVILRKTGRGQYFVTSDIFGDLHIAAGTVKMSETSPSTNVTMSGGTLAGPGSTGPIVSAGGGTISPGDSPGHLGSGNLTWDSGITFAVELLNNTEITGHDQLVVGGTVSLGGAALDVSLLPGFTTAVGQTFRIIINDTTTDPVTGTFAGLPEGAHFFNGAHLFRISYTGGDGNDTVLTVVEPTAPEITASSIAPGTGPTAGSQVIALTGTGLSGLPYVLEFSSDLITWTPLQTTTAGPAGAWSFNDSTLPVTTARTFIRVRLE